MATTATPYSWDRRLSASLAGLDRRIVSLVLICLSLLILAQFKFWNMPVRMDRANWDYFAQVIARGGVPYRDVMNIKSPGSAYIGAAAITLSRPTGLRDVYAIRIIYIFLAALTVLFTYLIAEDYFASRPLALMAALIMLSFNSFASLNSRGVEPKTPMILFGLVALWAVIKDRPVMAGLFGMLSALCWQPGLLFLGVAGLAFSRYFTAWRDPKLAKVAAGAAAPLIALLVYFWVAGALGDFYLWCIHYNYTVYAPQGRRPIGQFFERLSEVVGGSYRAEKGYFYLAAAGFFVAAGREVSRVIKGGAGYLRGNAPRQAILFPVMIYFAFCMINLQGNADLIPFLPFVAIFAPVALSYIWRVAVGALARSRPGRDFSALEGRGLALGCLIIFIVSVSDAFSYEARSTTLARQDADVREIVSNLEPGDKIFVHGQTEVLVLSGLTNASKYFFLDRGKDNYLDVVEPGGFYGWFERLKSERPKVVALSRLRPVMHAQDFLDWVQSDYEQRRGDVMEYYVRKD